MLTPWVVLFRAKGAPPADPPSGFACLAEDEDHAAEQCLDAEPGADVVWIWHPNPKFLYEAALASYFDVERIET